MKRILLCGLAVYSTALWNMAIAHTTTSRALDEPGVVVQFGYIDGTLMPFSAVQVFAPDDYPQRPHQAGRTDANGRFAFSPSVPGEWRVVVKDDEGHESELSVNVDPTKVAAARHPFLSNWLLILSLALNLAWLGPALIRRLGWTDKPVRKGSG